MEADNNDYEEMDEPIYHTNDQEIDFDMFPSGVFCIADWKVLERGIHPYIFTLFNLLYIKVKPLLL